MRLSQNTRLTRLTHAASKPLFVEFPFDQRQAIVAEEHDAIDENRWRPESAPLDQLIGIGSELRFVLGGGDFSEVFPFIEARFSHYVAQDVVLADVAIVTPVALEYSTRIERDFSMFLSDKRSAHGLD